MKMKLLAALLLSAGALVPHAAHASAVDLASCCTAGDKDFPKVGGNLGNQNYTSLRQINKGLVKKLGGHIGCRSGRNGTAFEILLPAWAGAGATGTSLGTPVALPARAIGSA